MSTGTEAPLSRERVHQKTRTRRALLNAAAELVRQGLTPTVTDVADAASISRATAYRYFPSQEALLAEAEVRVHLGDPAQLAPDLLFPGSGRPEDVEDRIAVASDTMYDLVVAREQQFRRFLPTQIARGLETSRDRGPQRGGHRVPLIDAALEPVAAELGPERLASLQHALAVLIGPEAMIVARDVLDIDHARAKADLAWACRALVRAALAEATADASGGTSASAGPADGAAKAPRARRSRTKPRPPL